MLYRDARRKQRRRDVSAQQQTLSNNDDSPTASVVRLSERCQSAADDRSPPGRYPNEAQRRMLPFDQLLTERPSAGRTLGQDVEVESAGTQPCILRPTPLMDREDVDAEPCRGTDATEGPWAADGLMQ